MKEYKNVDELNEICKKLMSQVGHEKWKELCSDAQAREKIILSNSLTEYLEARVNELVNDGDDETNTIEPKYSGIRITDDIITNLVIDLNNCTDVNEFIEKI
jgi:hypothetical protein